ncbi:MAG: dipeptidase, partial [Actinomycetales bacterium]|nr:dipeptidase [Actinomycetales bacterium]
MVGIEELRQRVSDTFPQVVADLEALIRIPSVSADAFDQARVSDSAA